MYTPVKFSTSGPEGWLASLKEPFEAAQLIEGDAVGNDHIYFESKSRGIRAGIWRAEPYTEYFENYPCDEFMYVLEGSVTLENNDFSETYGKGDAFLLPRGFRGFWRQTVPMLKYYVILN